MRQKIDRLTGKPVKYVVSTHYHPNHVDSNDLFRLNGAEIIGQANLAGRMMDPPELNPFTHAPLESASPKALPTITYTDRMTVNLGDLEVLLVHVDAHTDHDTLVIVPERNVIFTGDVTMMSFAPPDIASKGSVDGQIRAVDLL